jgi:hypothetical protein
MEHVPEQVGKRKFTGRRGDPNKAPRCGAIAKSTGRPCQAPAMKNPATGRVLRCRMHGGGSPGPTPEGRARIAAIHTKHGRYTKQAEEARKKLRKCLEALKGKKEDPR